MNKELENYLLTFPDKITKQMSVSKKEDCVNRQFLHISINNNISEFIPRISDRQLKQEDRTIPRVVGAPTLYGCILGYNTVHLDYLNNDNKIVSKDSMWKGGYQIYSFDYDYRVSPTDKLLPDVKTTDEVWLLGYSKDTKVYKPKKVGKFFVEEFLYKPKEEAKPTIQATIYLSVTSDEPLAICKDIELSKGFWKITLPVWDMENWTQLGWDKTEDLKHEEISREDFYDYKKRVASLLDHDGTIPNYLKW